MKKWTFSETIKWNANQKEIGEITYIIVHKNHFWHFKCHGTTEQTLNSNYFSELKIDYKYAKW